MRKKKRRLTILIKDANLTRWPIRDYSNLTFSTGENGCKDASWIMAIPFSFGIEEVFLNGPVYILEDTGELVWYGRVEEIRAQKQDTMTMVTVRATGAWSALFDTYFSGSIGSYDFPDGMLIYLLGLVNWDVTGISPTGLTSRTYTTPNDGTDHIRLGEAILEICSMGTSTTGDQVLPQVWEEHKFLTKIMKATPTADYSVSMKNLLDVTISRNLSAIYSKVRHRYKDSYTQMLGITTAQDTSTQQLLGNYYNSSSTFRPLIRELIQDMTGEGDASDPQAQTNSEALLAKTKFIRGEPQNIVLPRNYVVRDEVGLQEVAHYAVRAGTWLIIRDLYGHPTDFTDQSTIQNPGSDNVQLMVYISETRYDDETETLTLTPGVGSGLNSSDGVM